MFFLAAAAGPEKRLMRFWSFWFFTAAAPRMFYPLVAWKVHSMVRRCWQLETRPLSSHSRIRMDHRPQSRVGFLCSDINFLLISSSAGHDAEEGRGECWCQGLIRAEGPGAAEPKLVLVSSWSLVLSSILQVLVLVSFEGPGASEPA